jgi:two-component system response regulator
MKRLATVHRIVQKHGGRIWAEAEVDHGAILFHTRRQRSRWITKRCDHGRSLIMNSTQTDVLLVDDSQEEAELTSEILQREKRAANIHLVRDGEDALDFLFCRNAFAERSFARPPKVVLLDLKLPKVNGIQVLEQLKSDYRTRFIPVVILSSSNEERDLVRSYELGANSYIQKPMDFEKFRYTVKTVVLYWLAINQPSPVTARIQSSGAGS